MNRWTSTDCSKAWGVTPVTARRLMKRCKGWEYGLDDHNNRIITVPARTPKPSGDKPGAKLGSKRTKKEPGE